MADVKDVKPNMGDTISIKIKPESGEPTLFKVKMNTKMSKIMDTFASRMGQPRKAMRFVFDDKPIQEEDTPASLAMEEGDQVDVFIPQVGGSA